MSAVLVVAAVVVVGALLLRVADWWDIQRHRYHGLADKRVLDPVAKRLTWGK